MPRRRDSDSHLALGPTQLVILDAVIAHELVVTVQTYVSKRRNN